MKVPDHYTVVDLTPQCEVRSQLLYTYRLLEGIEGATDLINSFTAEICKQPNEFEAPLGGGDLIFRWCASSPTTGIATLRNSNKVLSLSLLASGLNIASDQITLQAFQDHAVRELHNTQFEPSFDLIGIQVRPLLATVGFAVPHDSQQRQIFAMVDRCFAAAYFRRLGLV